MELGRALLVMGQEVLDLVLLVQEVLGLVAMAQEVLVLGQGVLDQVCLVDMDLVAKQLGQGSLPNLVTARRWVELAMDQVKCFIDAYKYFIKRF